MEHLRWRPTVNERDFIERALQSNFRVDGRHSFDFRKLKISFGREDGSSEVQLGETHVLGHVTAQLVQPYRDRPNEGTLAIFTEFSPMADPAFEPGRPGESAIELGRVIDRGLRESRAVDMESLCVVAGKHVWSVRVDLHILDNGGNLIDAANIAALAALSTFRRPECTVGGDDGQQVIVHDPEVDSYTTEKALKKVKRLPVSLPQKINVSDVTMEDKGDAESETQTVKTPSDVQQISKGDEDHRNIKRNSPLTGERIAKHKQTSTFIGGPSNWDPYSKGVSLSSLRISQLPDPATIGKASSHEDAQPMLTESSNTEVKSTSSSGAAGESEEAQEIGSPKSLKDAIKPKHKRKKKKSDRS